MPSEVLRAETASDTPAIASVVRAAFGQEDEVLLVDAIRASEQFVPELSLVAEVDGELVGHVLFSHATLHTPAGTEQVLALAPVAVAPAHQNSGIGTRLVEAGLDVARRRGENLVIVLGHPAYYPRFGFRPASQMGIEPPAPFPDEAFMALALDESVTAPTGKLEYPPAFGV